MQRRTFIYTAALGAIAGAAGIPAFSNTARQDYLVRNSGIGGNNTIDLLKRIDKDCIAHSPALTVLMIGTNDMNSMKYVPLEQFRANLSTIIEKIQAKGSKVLLMTICPFIEEFLLTRHKRGHYGEEGPSGRRLAVNDTIRALAAQHHTSLLDLGALFDKAGKVGTGKDSLIQNPENSGKTDGVHPTVEGYRFIGLAVYDFIVYNGLPKERIVCFGDSITAGDGGTEKNSYPAVLKRLLAG